MAWRPRGVRTTKPSWIRNGSYHFLQRAGVFPYGGSQRGDAYRTAAEFVDQSREHPVVHFIQTVFIYREGFEADQGNVPVDGPRALYLGKVADAAQQGIGYAGVPRERREISKVASSVMGMCMMRAERSTMAASVSLS